ncbi:acylphosphatase [Stieleria sp. JC731]|uniref:acylphosphatase n=1 Tax=Pirellulaceae TaxID=2691357 RepID=UPI001E631CCE|nr:acylphosphatase [Stieleria sp. JC731]MCC9599897.1 acylphosphatase [Stieleria sp. JC731]
MNKRVVVRYHGRVQGVGFRATALHHGRGLDVHGFVRNEFDGSVLMDVEGPKTHLDELLQRIESRPAGSIDHSDVSWEKPLGRSSGFSIA